MQLTIHSISELPDCAKQLLAFSREERIFLFFGEMGVGKTTMIKSMGQQLGVIDHITSPTYSIINEYATTKNYAIYHFDCYRLKTEAEVLDLGFEDYLSSRSYCLVEWPERIRCHWPRRYVKVVLSMLNDTARSLFAEVITH